MMRFCCLVACVGEGIRAAGRATGQMPQDLFAADHIWVNWIPAIGWAIVALRVVLKGTEE